MVYENLVFTKLFRDGVRHIDYVLVIKDDGDEGAEQIRINFLMHAIKFGLELEIEQGVMNVNKDLLFIKVHAPDSVIEEFGSYFCIRKYFKETHLEFINVNRSLWGLPEMLFNCRKRRPEKEWLQLVRNLYPGPMSYSPLERSTIVHRILMTLPFGIYQNYFSMCRLLEKSILIDAYALHDGPYFLLRNQNTSKVNARQILYFNWIGFRNWLATQPSYLIQEYMGERIAFYFTFFEYYIFFLMISAVAGIITVILEVFDNADDILTREVCTTHLTNSVVRYICPVCKEFKACPFRETESYCFHVLLLNLLDSPATVYYSIFIGFWSIIFICYWSQKENYLSWMWEIDQDALKNTLRPEYMVDREKKIVRSKWTGIMNRHDNIRMRCKQYGLTLAIAALCALCVLVMIIMLIKFKYWMMTIMASEFESNMTGYMQTILLAVMNVYLVYVLEKITCYLSYKLTNHENHRTQGSYERSLVFRLVGPSIAFTFALLLFFAFLKGSIFSRPNDMSRWKLPLQIGIMNCGPLSCLDEVWIILGIMLICKEILFKGSMMLFGHRCHTDYNQGKWVNKHVPCWEKELQMQTITEDMIMNRYKSLAVQFGLVTLFVSAFPLGPALALYMNLLQIRRDAKLFLLKCKRPTLYKSNGIGAWRYVFLVIVYIACMTNAMSIAFTTRGIIRWIYIHNGWHMFDYTYLEYSMSQFYTESYLNTTGGGKTGPKALFEEYSGFKPNICFYPGFQRFVDQLYLHTAENWYTKYLEFIFVFAYQHVVLLIVMTLHYAIPARGKDIRQTLDLEQKIKNKYYSSKDIPGKVKNIYQ